MTSLHICRLMILVDFSYILCNKKDLKFPPSLGTMTNTAVGIYLM